MSVLGCSKCAQRPWDAPCRACSERIDGEARIKDSKFADGDTVFYDDDRGVVLETYSLAPHLRLTVQVMWDNGHVCAVWQSDLMSEAEYETWKDMWNL